jgi:phosphoribosylformylglycinamidine synthase subunit PurSL
MQRIEVALKSQLPDARGQGLIKDIQDLGITTVTGARVIDIYWLDADLPLNELEAIGRRLLADPVTQDAVCLNGPGSAVKNNPESDLQIIEVAYNPGVADPVEETISKAIQELGVEGVKAVRTTRRYMLSGRINKNQLSNISSRLLVNPIIQHVLKPGQFSFPQKPTYDFKLVRVDFLGKSGSGIEQVKKQFNFSGDELQAIVNYYHEEGRNPTDVELETLAQTWSEHCVHKTFKSKIKFGTVTVDNLLKSTIIKATRQMDKPWCVSVFEDNAGVIDFDDKWAICFKVETHNHPSAVEPYGGAATGLGGVVRDILGVGLGAKPIANTDVFCFGPPDLPYRKVPKGVLHPRRMFKGVRAGVADYGNRLGIPTLNGAVCFDERYTGNPLVYCGTLGIMPKEMGKPRKHKPGDLVVVAGGRTGRDGVHGVTFASEKLTGESSSVSYSSVQIGNPIVEKKLIDVILQARDRGLYSRITDCGGGGLSSAVGEMGAETGVRVDLEKVPLKYAGLTYSEIWISESQERMLMAVPPEHRDELLKLCESESVEASVIGEFTDDKHLRLFYKGNPVGDLSMKFLHEGLPQIFRKITAKPPVFEEPEFGSPADLGGALMDILGTWNVCSKEWVIRQYDHEVQGGNVLKPLVGKYNDGPGDASVIRPILSSKKGVIISSGINPKYGDVDAYWMAASAIDEALRQIICVGGNLNEVALLDNFAWGNTDKPEEMMTLVWAAQACHDMSIDFGTPFISGKDSLYNEFEFEGEAISIPHTLLVSAIGVVENADKCISMDFKKPGDIIYILGDTRNEMGGSAYYGIRGFKGNKAPRVEAKTAKELMNKLSQATDKGLVKACHDCSEGGIGVALAEMAFAGGLGATIDLKPVPQSEPIGRDDFILFSESNSRFLVEVAQENKNDFERIMRGADFSAIGRVTDTNIVMVRGLKTNIVVSASIDELKESWQKPLRW